MWGGVIKPGSLAAPSDHVCPVPPGDCSGIIEGRDMASVLHVSMENSSGVSGSC